MLIDYIYVEWLWYGWWIHICWLIVILLVNAYILSDGDVVGDCIYAKWMMMMWWRLLIELWLDWLCGRKYLIMQLLLKLINVNGGVLLCCCWWIFMLEILHYSVFACMSMHHSHIESYEKCKRRCTFTQVNCKRRCTLTKDVLLASWGDDLVVGDGTECI